MQVFTQQQAAAAGSSSKQAAAESNMFATFLQHRVHFCNMFAICWQHRVHFCNIVATVLQQFCNIFATFLQHFCNLGSPGDRSSVVAKLGTGALQRQEGPNGHQAGQPGRILVKLTRRIALLEHLPECQICGLGSSSGQEATVAAFGVLQERCSVRERCRGRIRSVAAYRSVAEAGMTKWSPSRSTWQNPS